MSKFEILVQSGKASKGFEVEEKNRDIFLRKSNRISTHWPEKTLQQEAYIVDEGETVFVHINEFCTRFSRSDFESLEIMLKLYEKYSRKNPLNIHRRENIQ